MGIRDTKCVVVGGCGFLGSHVVDHLINDRNCDVLVLDNLSAGHKKFLHPKAEFIHHDITHSEESTRKLLEGYDYVFQYAATPFIPESFTRPVHASEITGMAALKVMQAAHEAGCKRILQVSSAEIYGKDYNDKDENTPIEPHSSYGVAKVFADGMVQVRAREAGCPVMAVRMFNNYGPRETHPYVIPEIISQLSVGNTVKLGNNSFRDFLYAEDSAKMAVELLEKGQLGEVYNMGSGDGIQIYDLAILIGEIMGHSEVDIIRDPARIRPWEIWHLKAKCDKLHSVIGSRPETSFVDGLRKTIDYFRANGGWDF